jgi:hypothetical protein
MIQIVARIYAAVFSADVQWRPSDLRSANHTADVHGTIGCMLLFEILSG